MQNKQILKGVYDSIIKMNEEGVEAASVVEMPIFPGGLPRELKKVEFVF